MSKKVSGTEDISIKYRAVCGSCDYLGRWRPSKSIAQEDANKHAEVNKGHGLDIEIEKSQRFREAFSEKKKIV